MQDDDAGVKYIRAKVHFPEGEPTGEKNDGMGIDGRVISFNWGDFRVQAQISPWCIPANLSRAREVISEIVEPAAEMVIADLDPCAILFQGFLPLAANRKLEESLVYEKDTSPGYDRPVFKVFDCYRKQRFEKSGCIRRPFEMIQDSARLIDRCDYIPSELRPTYHRISFGYDPLSIPKDPTRLSRYPCGRNSMTGGSLEGAVAATACVYENIDALAALWSKAFE